MLAAESERVGGGNIKCREGGVGGCGGHRTEGGVLIVRGDAASRLVGNQVGDVLIAIMEIEEVVRAGRPLHPQGAGGDGLGWIPAESEIDGVVCGGVETLDAEVAVVDETVMRVGCSIHRFDVFNPAAHPIELHRDVRGTARPQDRAILPVVRYRPVACSSTHKGLVAVQVE